MRTPVLVVVVVTALLAGPPPAWSAPRVAVNPGALFSHDVNRDGKADVVLIDPTDAPQAAAVVYGSADRSVPVNRVTQGPHGFAISYDGQRLGRVSIIGDVNGDGYADIAVGVAEQGFGRPPGAWLVFGAKASIPIDLGAPPPGRTARLPDARSPEFGGAAAVGVGDVNGDGISDLATGQEIKGKAGAVVVFGRRRWPAVQRFKNLSGTGYLIHRGSLGHAPLTPSAVGDANGDGRADIALLSSDPFARAVMDDSPTMAWIVYGKPGRQSVALATRSVTDARVRVGQKTAGFGIREARECFCSFERLGAAGDTNGDQRADLLVAEPVSAGHFEDRISVLFGAQRSALQRGIAPGPRGNVLRTGSVVATGLGDVTGDHLSDVVAGFPLRNVLLIYAGQRVGTLRPPGIRWISSPSAAIIEALPAGDVDGDGRQDLLLRLDGSVAAAIVYGQATLAEVDLGSPGASATIIK